MGIYIVAAAIIGLAVLRYARWRPGPAPEFDASADEERRGWGCGMSLLAVFAIVVLILLALWAYVLGRP